MRLLNEKMAILLVSHDLGTVTRYVRSIACVNRKLHFHDSAIITSEDLAAYNCPIRVLSHSADSLTPPEKHHNHA